ncbi:MAG TPA: hypothetical protein VK843_11395 [Planctomycetota bacterium]|nr:hypothetical protein [Planctomycetota bacterium]
MQPLIIEEEVEPDPKSESGWGSIFLLYAVLALVIAVPFLWLRHTYSELDPYWGRGKISFHREAWLAATEDSPTWGERFLMLDDLLKGSHLEGCTRSKVSELLGPPFMEWQGMWRYYLGPEPGIVSVDSILLCIRFDSAGVVESTFTHTN